MADQKNPIVLAEDPAKSEHLIQWSSYEASGVPLYYEPDGPVVKDAKLEIGARVYVPFGMHGGMLAGIVIANQDKYLFESDFWLGHLEWNQRDGWFCRGLCNKAAIQRTQVPPAETP